MISHYHIGFLDFWASSCGTSQLTANMNNVNASKKSTESLKNVSLMKHENVNKN